MVGYILVFWRWIKINEKKLIKVIKDKNNKSAAGELIQIYYFVKRLYLDGDYLWIGTTMGLYIYNVKDKSIININKLLIDANVKYLYSNAITKDSDGVYWLGMFLVLD